MDQIIHYHKSVKKKKPGELGDRAPETIALKADQQRISARSRFGPGPALVYPLSLSQTTSGKSVK